MGGGVTWDTGIRGWYGVEIQWNGNMIFTKLLFVDHLSSVGWVPAMMTNIKSNLTVCPSRLLFGVWIFSMC